MTDESSNANDANEPTEPTESGAVEPASVEQTAAADPMAAALGGGLDLGAMMQAAQSMQEQMASSQQQLAEAQVVGTAGGGLVSVTLNGHLHLLEVHIDPKSIDPEDPSITEDLIRAAWQDAHDQVAVIQQQSDPMSGLLGGGGSLGGLGDLLGGL